MPCGSSLGRFTIPQFGIAGIDGNFDDLPPCRGGYPKGLTNRCSRRSATPPSAERWRSVGWPSTSPTWPMPNPEARLRS